MAIVFIGPVGKASANSVGTVAMKKPLTPEDLEKQANRKLVLAKALIGKNPQAVRRRLAEQRKKATDQTLADVKKMTLTVIDGDFPREVLAVQNLVFSEYKMPARGNTAEYYDVKSKKPAGKRQGVLKLGQLSSPGSRRPGGSRLGAIGLVASLTLALTMIGLSIIRRRGIRGVRRGTHSA